MVQLIKNSSLSLHLFPVRCYFTTKDIAASSGILANLSLALETRQTGEKPSTTRWMLINHLTLRISENNELFLGSHAYQRSYVKEGKEVIGPSIFYFKFLPGNAEETELAELQEHIMEDLLKECTTFVKEARARRDSDDGEPRFQIPRDIGEMLENITESKEQPKVEKKGEVPF